MYVKSRRTKPLSSILTFDTAGEDNAVTDVRDLSPTERWDELDCADAYSDALNVWQNYDPKHDRYTFIESMADTFHYPLGAECGQINGQCELQKCSQDDGTGPAGAEIWNSFVYIHDMYNNYYATLDGAAGTAFTASLPSFENTFAPVPPPKQVPEWEEILIAIVTLGASLISAPFFNSSESRLRFARSSSNLFLTDSIIVFKTLPIFTSELGKEGLGVTKDFTSAFITFGSNIAKVGGKETDVHSGSSQLTFCQDTVTPGIQ